MKGEVEDLKLEWAAKEFGGKFVTFSSNQGKELRVSGIWLRFILLVTKETIFWHLNTPLDHGLKLWMAVYPRKRARTALKLRQNAFQNIPVILFFDEKKKIREKKIEFF